MKNLTDHSIESLDWKQVSSFLGESFKQKCSMEKLTNAAHTLKIDEITKSWLQFSRISQYFKDHGWDNFHQSYAFYQQVNVLNDLATQISKQAPLDLQDLNSIFQFYEQMFKLKPYISLLDHAFETQEVFKSISPVLGTYRSLITPDGQLEIKNNPQLHSLHNSILELEFEIRGFASKLGQNETFKDSIQYEGIDTIDDQYVIAIRSDSFSSDMGSIKAHSNSGNTLYVQPKGLKSLSDKRFKLKAELQRKLFKISQSIIEKLSVIPLHFHIKTLENLDYYFNLAWIFDQYRFSQPELLQDQGLYFKKLFHPLVEKAIGNDLELIGDQGFLISGPNTGGKTVLLKALGLSYMLFWKGLYVPAEEAKIFPYKGPLFIASDLQNLGEGLSSFSGEIELFLQLLDKSPENTLIIVDEILNSTSSEEASAIAMALIKKIQSKPNFVAISTHHQLLKAWIHQAKNLKSGRMGFSSQTLNPTYKVAFGEPGSSHAKEILQRLLKNKNYSHELMDSITELETDGIVQYENLLASLNKKYHDLESRILENNQLKENLLKQEKSFKGSWELEKEKLKSQLYQEQDHKLKEIDQLFEKVKSSEISSEKTLHKYKQSLKPHETKTVKPRGYSVEVFRKDFIYWHKQLSIEVKPIKIQNKGKKAIIQQGVLKQEIKIADVLEVRPKEISQAVHQAILSKGEAVTNVDGRGLTTEEFEEKIVKFVQPLLYGEIPYLEVVHGHGGGVLKKWLRENFCKEYSLEWETGANGNDGSSILKLS